MKSSYSVVRSMESPRLGAMVNGLRAAADCSYRTRRTRAPHFRWQLMVETTGASRAHSHFTLGTTCDWIGLDWIGRRDG
jgi:hypothetical protein